MVQSDHTENLHRGAATEETATRVTHVNLNLYFCCWLVYLMRNDDGGVPMSSSLHTWFNKQSLPLPVSILLDI